MRIESPVLIYNRHATALRVWSDVDNKLRICDSELRRYWNVPTKDGARIVLVASDEPVRGAQYVDLLCLYSEPILPHEKTNSLRNPSLTRSMRDHLVCLTRAFGSTQFWGWVEIVEHV